MLSKQPPGVRAADLAVRLQEIAIPSDVPFKLEVGLAYAAQSRGLVLHAVGQNPATAQFGEVVANESEANPTAQSCCAIHPLTVSGKDLEMACRPECGWNLEWRIPGDMKLSFQAARSIG